MEREQINFEVVNKGKVPEIKIYGYIGKWDEVNLEGLKRKIEAVVAKNDEVKLLINSGGGSVLEGFAIYDMLAKADIKVHAVVEGMAASMASIILLAADNIDIYENARIMTHKPKAGWWGEADGMRGMADTMDDMEAAMKAIYMKRTGKTKTVVDGWLKAGVDVWHSATKAVENGLADKVIKTVKKKGSKAVLEQAQALLEEAQSEEQMVVAYCSMQECITTSEEVIDKQENSFMKKVFAQFPSLNSILFPNSDKGVEGASASDAGDNGTNSDADAGEASEEEIEASTEKLIEAFKKDGYRLVKSEDMEALNTKVEAVLKAKTDADAAVEAAEATVAEKQTEVDAKQSEIDAKIQEVEDLKAEKKTLQERVAAITGDESGSQDDIQDADAEEEDKPFSTVGMSDADAANAILLHAQGIDLNKREVAEA